MRIIGLSKNDHYIAEIHHSEVEMFLNLYYNKLKPLTVGEFVDLGKGYRFDQDIKSALRQTQDFIAANQKIVEAILNGLKFMGADHPGPDPTKATNEKIIQRLEKVIDALNNDNIATTPELRHAIEMAVEEIDKAKEDSNE